MFPIFGDVRRDLHTISQGAEEAMLRRIDHDSHVTPPNYQVPRSWLNNTLEFFDSPINSAGGRVLVVQPNTFIQ